METIRLNKYMAHLGLCSRREADALIADNMVEVDGELAPPTGMMVDSNAKIKILEKGRNALDEKFAIILNKPRGFVSHLPVEDQIEALSLVRPDRYRGEEVLDLEQMCHLAQSASVAGRLDRSSRGLMVFSTDGRLVRALTGGGTHQKKYVVRCKMVVSDEQIDSLNAMRRLLHWNIMPMEVRALSSDRLVFVLREGKKHQIREACHHVGLEISDLYRVQMGPLELGPLPEGCWRLVNQDEKDAILRAESRT